MALLSLLSCSGQKDYCRQAETVVGRHLNYNHNAPFYALYSANRIEQAEPYWRPLLAFVPRGKYYLEKALGIADGVLYPVGIGSLGIETTRWSALMEKYRKGWKDEGNIEDEGMFWK